jgi:nitroreductase
MSVKTARPDHPILDLVARRWSPRAFADRPVEAEKLRSLFEAARWAASCFGEQPWSFVVAPRQDAEAFETLAGCLVAGNAWARQAPVLALSVAALNFARNGAPNRHAWHDVGLAMGNLSAQATSLELFVHQMAGFDPDRARQLLDIPATHAPVAMMAIGYLGDPSTLTPEQQQRETAPRQRKSLAEFVFGGKWGRTSDWLR